MAAIKSPVFRLSVSAVALVHGGVCDICASTWICLLFWGGGNGGRGRSKLSVRRQPVSRMSRRSKQLNIAPCFSHLWMCGVDYDHEEASDVAGLLCETHCDWPMCIFLS